MTRPDLHLHSTASDGVLSPETLAYEAQEAGVTLMALTDHDTFAGTDLLREKGSPVPLITGIELSMKDMHGLHLLAYGSARADALRARVQELADRRADRAWQMLDRLAEMGMPLSRESVQRRACSAIGRPHIARAMVRAGYASSMQDAFERYLNPDRPAYVAAERMGMAEALDLVNGCGFIPVLAHPYELKLPDEQLSGLIARWRGMGLQGIEVYHPSARARGFDMLRNTARRLDMLVTGGSDFHQAHDKHGAIGCMAGSWAEAERDTARLMEAMARAAAKDGTH